MTKRILERIDQKQNSWHFLRCNKQGKLMFLSRLGNRIYPLAPIVSAQRPFTSTIDVKKILSFEEFQKQNCPTYEKYKSSVLVRSVFNLNDKKMRQAYDFYCQGRFQSYRKKMAQTSVEEQRI
jgi:hypothetical protein